MLNILQANYLQSYNPTDTLITKGRYYCWTYGRSYNRFHTSAPCESSTESHQKGAIWGNKLGSTERDHTSKSNWDYASKTRNKNKFNQSIFPQSTLLENITTRISPLIADTGATGTFLEMSTSYFNNIKKDDPGIDVLCPNTQF